MASDLGLTSLAPFRKSKQAQTQILSVGPMWNNNSNNDDDHDDDSWEVRAFEEDTTGNLLGCTWPPRSYTCTFCRREFRSAQALGGHMNVHRRDRARLHEIPPAHPPSPTVATPPSSAILIPTGQEFVANGLCLLYPLPNPNSIVIPNPPLIDYSYPLPPMPHFATNKATETAPNSVVSSLCHSTNTEPSASASNSNGGDEHMTKDTAAEEELDLELRLGRRPPPQP